MVISFASIIIAVANIKQKKLIIQIFIGRFEENNFLNSLLVSNIWILNLTQKRVQLRFQHRHPTYKQIRTIIFPL